jgi:hypothetical protein
VFAHGVDLQAIGALLGCQLVTTCRHCCVSLLLEAGRASFTFVCPQRSPEDLQRGGKLVE